MNENEVKIAPRLALYHATGRGTGSAATFEVVPATAGDGGAIRLKLARQATVGNRQGPTPSYSRFDWEHALVVKLGFADLCAFLQVFRGERESLADGRGLLHVSARAQTSIRLSHRVEPAPGYSLEVYRKTLASGEESRAAILLTDSEAVGLCEAIAGSMAVICFGVPVERPSAPRAAKEAGDAAAA